MDINKEIEDKIYKMFSKAFSDKNIIASNTATTDNVLTKEKLDSLIESLKPKKVIFTPDAKLYNKILELPYMNEDCIKLDIHLNETIIVDMEKLKTIIDKPFRFTTTSL